MAARAAALPCAAPTSVSMMAWRASQRCGLHTSGAAAAPADAERRNLSEVRAPGGLGAGASRPPQRGARPHKTAAAPAPPRPAPPALDPGPAGHAVHRLPTPAPRPPPPPTPTPQVVSEVVTRASSKEEAAGQPGVLDELARYAAARADELAPQEIRNLCVSFAQMVSGGAAGGAEREGGEGRGGSAWVAHSERRLRAGAPGCWPHTRCPDGRPATGARPSQGYFNPTFKSAVADVIISRLEDFEPALLADTAWWVVLWGRGWVCGGGGGGRRRRAFCGGTGRKGGRQLWSPPGRSR
jgi:hypothetical protein